MGSASIRVLSNSAFLPPVPMPPVLTSDASPWAGFRVELHDIWTAAGEMPNPLAFDRNQLVLHCGEQSYWKHWRHSGREQGVFVRPGDVALISRQEVAGNRWNGRHRLLVVAIDDESFQQALAEELAGGGADFEIIPSTTDDILKRMLLQLKRELEFGCPSGRLYGESLITAIISYALPRYGIVRPVLRQYHRGLSSARLKRVLEYIDDCLGRDLGVPELASVAGLSQYHFCKLFRVSMGRTVHQYVLDRRMDAACGLIDRSVLSLAAIGAQVGFLNPCHFSAAFRRRMGITPREYRNSRTRDRSTPTPLFL